MRPPQGRGKGTLPHLCQQCNCDALSFIGIFWPRSTSGSEALIFASVRYADAPTRALPLKGGEEMVAAATA